MKIVVAAGGTGGHVFPAQVLAQDLKDFDENCEIIFMAHGLVTNSRFQRQLQGKQFPFWDVCSAKMPQNIFGWPKVGLKICYGILQSVIRLVKYKPDIIIGFGSYHTLPVLAAAWLLSIPFILHSSDIIPGRINRLFAPYANWIATFLPNVMHENAYISEQVALPLRTGFSFDEQPTREEAKKYYGLSDNKVTILVFGGSQGAKVLNEQAARALVYFAQTRDIQILHFTGTIESALEIKQMYEKNQISSIVKDFEHNMAYAWAAADCAILRSGALTIAEQIAFAVPAIFIPYPYAQDNHQYYNAQFVEKHLGGGRCIEQSTLTPHQLALMLEQITEKNTTLILKENLKRAQYLIKGKKLSSRIIDFIERSHKHELE